MMDYIVAAKQEGNPPVLNAEVQTLTTTSPFREPPCDVKPVGEEPMPRLDAAWTFATRTKIVKGDHRKLFFRAKSSM
jgi:hypothetical protein